MQHDDESVHHGMSRNIFDCWNAFAVLFPRELTSSKQCGRFFSRHFVLQTFFYVLFANFVVDSSEQDLLYLN